MRRVLPTLALLFCAATAAYALAQTASEKVDLELLLLADATGSIDDGEIHLQRQGYADALSDPDLVKSMTAGYHGRLALSYVEWADAQSQDVVVAWRVIDGPESAADFAADLMGAPRTAYGRNAIGAALIAGVAMIETNAFDGDRKVIDFSADSANNWNGPNIEDGRQTALAAGVTINGLAVLCRFCSGRPVFYDLEAAFEEQIIGGPGAFVITADSEATFAAAVRQKLFLEVSGLTPPKRLAQQAD